MQVPCVPQLRPDFARRTDYRWHGLAQRMVMQRTPSSLRALMFDLDGTLLDSFPAHFSAYQATFSRFGIEVNPDEFLRVYTPDWYQVYRAMGLAEEHWDLADSFWMAAAAQQQPELFPGAKDLLLRLQGRYLLGLVTSGSRERVLRDLARTGIGGTFQVIVTGDDVTQAKPAPEGLRIALDSLGVQSSEALYVGDTDADYDMARAARVQFVGVDGPFLSADRDQEFHLLKTITDLLGVLEPD